VGAVGTVDIQCRVGFGIALFLRLRKRLAEVQVVLCHVGQDVVACAVEYAVDRVDTVGRQSRSQREHYRNAAGAARLKGDAFFRLARRGEQLGAMLGKQGLVGGNDVFAGGKHLQQQIFGDRGAAYKLHGDIDGVVIKEPAKVVGEHPVGQFHRTGGGGIQIDDRCKFDIQRGFRFNGFGVVQQQVRHACPHGAETHHAHSYLVAVHNLHPRKTRVLPLFDYDHPTYCPNTTLLYRPGRAITVAQSAAAGQAKTHPCGRIRMFLWPYRSCYHLREHAAGRLLRNHRFGLIVARYPARGRQRGRAFSIRWRLSGLVKAFGPLGLCLAAIFTAAANFFSSGATKTTGSASGAATSS